MNIENMEQEFPKMPQSMRDMIEKEVEKQRRKKENTAMNRHRGREVSRLYFIRWIPVMRHFGCRIIM